MKFQLIEAQKLYRQPDESSYVNSDLASGEVVEVGSEVKKNHRGWVPVRRSNGQSGYIPSETRVSHVKTMTVQQSEVSIFTEASISSSKRRLCKNAKILVYPGVVENGSEQFVKIQDASGAEGYMSGDTQVKTVPEITKSLGKANMLRGAIWFIIGLVVTFGTLALASSGDGGGTYVVMWGAVFFGAIQFFKGLIQFCTAPL